ncbi:MAG: FAD-dependent oxidoreductase [Lachnospiraceae bacterium]|nr:FAD-dependent oxidoreductase [Lachnospiraceae bacterium]
MDKTGSKKKIVIIGGGIAGLSAGIYALKGGFEAEIYEKNAIVGGECMGWNRKGFHIDNCIHWLTGTKKGTELYEVWKTVGALSDDTEYADIDSFYTTVYKGERVTLWNDLERAQKEMIEISPEDEDEIRKFFKYVEYSKQCLLPAAKPMEMWGIRDYIRIGKTMKDFPKVTKEYGGITLDEYSKRFRSPLLQRLMCDYLPKDYSAYAFLVSYATVADGNGNIPMGASLQMSLRMEKRFKELGGKITCNAGVKKIVMDNNTATGIELEDGTFIHADYIIPAIDTYPLFNSLLPEKYMPDELKTAYANPTHYPVTSGFQTAFATSGSFGYGETMMIDIEPLTVGKKTYERMYVKAYDYDPVYIKDGRHVIQTCITQFDEDFEYWKGLSKEEYAKAKEQLVSEIAKRIERAFPVFKDDLEFLDCWTPVTYERYCDAYHGSYMSFIATPGAKMISLKGRLKGTENIYPAGQWTSSTGGLPVAVASGKFAVQRILKSLKKDINI